MLVHACLSAPHTLLTHLVSPCQLVIMLAFAPAADMDPLILWRTSSRTLMWSPMVTWSECVMMEWSYLDT